MILAFGSDIGDALKIACENDFDAAAVNLARAAQIVRRQMFQGNYRFDGTFADESIPSSLLALVTMII